MRALRSEPHIQAKFLLILGLALASCKGGPTGPPSPTFSLSIASLTFSNTVEREVTITNVTSDPIDWRVLSSSASWANGTPTSGTLDPQASTNFTVRIDRRAIPQGTHTASLQIGAASYSTALTVNVVEAAAKASLLPGTIAISEQQSSATLEVVNSGGADLNWTLSGPSWSTPTPASGILQPGGRTQVSVAINRSSIMAGEGVGTLELVSNGGTATAQMTVAGISGLRLEPGTLDFSTSGTSLSLKVVNESDQALDWSAQPGPWVSLSHSAGNLPPGLAQFLTVQVSRAGLSHGTNQVPILFNTNRGSISATVLATVSPAGTPSPGPLGPSEMAIVPVSLNFGQTATELSFRVHNEGDTPLDWTANQHASWISLPISAGRVSPHSSTPVTIRVTRGGLTKGSYQSSVTFTSNERSITVIVTASVASTTTAPPTTPPPTNPPPTNPPPTVPAPAKISLSPTTLDFGLTSTERSFAIQNTGGTSLDWSAQSSNGWAILTTTTGRVQAGSSQNVTVRVSRAGLLAAGNYQGSIQVSSNGGGASVSVSLEVAAPLPPPPPVSAGTVNVRDFGAYGDGQHDDAGAFRSALAALGSSGGVLYVPAGTYILKPSGIYPRGGVDLRFRSNITVRGDGLDQTTLRMAPGSYLDEGATHLVYIKKSSQVTLRDLTLDGNRFNASFSDEQNHCVEVWSSLNVRIENVRIRFCRGDGVRLMGEAAPGDPWTDSVWIENSHFEDNGRSGIAVQRAVRNLYIRHNTFDRIKAQSIDIEPTGAQSPTDIFIENNVIHHSGGTWAVAPGGIGGTDVARRLVFSFNRIENGGAQFAKIDGLRIEGNTIIGDTRHSPLRLSHNVTNAVIVGNDIVGAGGSDIPVVDVGALNGGFPSRVTLQGNHINAVLNQTGIHVRDALGDVSILENEISGSGNSNGIHVENTVTQGSPRSGFSVIGNVVRNFKNAVQFSTRTDAFSNVVIQSNDIDYTLSSPTETVGLLFNETAPYQTFAVVAPNSYGPGIKTSIVMLGAQ
jgi:hypothetical protein